MPANAAGNGLGDLSDLPVGLGVHGGDFLRARQVEDGRPRVGHLHAEGRVERQPLGLQQGRGEGRHAAAARAERADQEDIGRCAFDAQPLEELDDDRREAAEVGGHDEAKALAVLQDARARAVPQAFRDGGQPVAGGFRDPLGNVLVVSRGGEVVDHARSFPRETEGETRPRPLLIGQLSRYSIDMTLTVVNDILIAGIVRLSPAVVRRGASRAGYHP